MKNVKLNFGKHLIFIFILSISFAKSQVTKIKEPQTKKGAFVSLNFSGFGMQGPGTQYMYYLILTGETGIWLKENLLTGISFSTPWFSNNMGIKKQSYTPFEANAFIKYYPFEKKSLKWLGIQTQAGLSNSGMNLDDPKEKLYTNLCFGPSVNLCHKSGFALNAAGMLDVKLGASALNKFVIYGQPFNIVGYLGLSYTFKKRGG